MNNYQLFTELLKHQQTKVELTINSQLYPFVPQSVAQIPWGHNRLIVSKPNCQVLRNWKMK